MPSTEMRSGRWRLRFAAVFCQAVLAATCIGAQQAAAVPQGPLSPIVPPRPDLPSLPTPQSQVAVQPAFSVVLDAAHGGSDSGARVAANSLEKDITLGFAASLRGSLAARGVPVVMTRDSDIGPSFNQRAGIANHALAAACLLIHATATGAGVHLFTSSLPPAATPPSAITRWETAQAAWVTRSLRLSSEINSALGQAGVPTTLGVASVQPLDNLACPAVAIEIAPLAASASSKALSVSDRAYQQRLLDALAAAVLEWSADWKQQP